MPEMTKSHRATEATLGDRLSVGLGRFQTCIREQGMHGLAFALGRRCRRGFRTLARLVVPSARYRPPAGPVVPLSAFTGTATTFKLDNALQFTTQQQPWRDCARPLAEINPIPSMIHPDESRLLYWLAATRYRGDGSIVDLGPLAGGSTHALAMGLAVNERAGPPRGQIESFDLWKYEEPFEQYFPGNRLRTGDDVQALFEANLGRLLPYVTPHKGDLCSHSGRGGPIEILFIDAAKSPAAMLHIVRRLFPRLIPGHSIVVHQDYISSTCPWIHLAMEQLTDYWQLADSPDGGSVCFVPVRPLPDNVLPSDFYETLPVRYARMLMQGARANIRGWYRLCLCLAEAFYLTQVQDYAEAEAIVRQVLDHPDFCASVQYDVDYVLSYMPRSHG